MLTRRPQCHYMCMKRPKMKRSAVRLLSGVSSSKSLYLYQNFESEMSWKTCFLGISLMRAVLSFLRWVTSSDSLPVPLVGFVCLSRVVSPLNTLRGNDTLFSSPDAKKIFVIHNNREWPNFYSHGNESLANGPKTTFYARFS